MSPYRLFGLGLLLGVLGVLAGVALSCPPTDASPPPPATDSTGGGEAVSPDPRWLDLIRARDESGVRLQAATPSLHVHLTDRTVAGRVSSPAAVSVRVSRGETTLREMTVQPVPEGDGYLYIAALFPDGYGYCGEPFLPGDVLWAVQGATVLSLTIPPLSALADPDADLISGTAPPSDTVALYLYPRAAPDAVLTQTAVADSEGAYRAGWAALRPGDTGFAAWNAAPNRAAYLRFVAPLLQVQVNGAEVLGMAPPCSDVALDVTDAAGNPLAQEWAWAGRNGRFNIWLWWVEKVEGLPQVFPGWRVRGQAAGQVFSTTVLPVTAQADRAGGQVLGEAPPGAPVRVEVFHGPTQSYYESIGQVGPCASARVTATAQGRYTATLPLAPADFGAAFAQGPDGHETFARFAVPYLWAILGRERLWHAYRLQGQVDGANVPITVTLQGPGGLVRDIRLLRSASNGFFRDLSSDTDPFLETGDVLTVETARGVQAALTLPLLTAQVDTLSETVSGQAPSGARLTVSIWGESGPWSAGGGPPYSPPPVWASQVVTAGADGTYIADFQGRVNLNPRSAGEVSLTTPEGHTVLRPFRAHDCRPVLTTVFVGGNYLSGLSGYGCPSATVRLIGPAGDLKAQVTANFSWWDQFHFYFYLHVACPWPDGCYDKSSPPILILPGDRIVMESGGSIYTTTVPTLTLEVDRETPALSGQAPAGETLRGEIRGEFYEFLHTFTTTVSPQGRYTVPLTGIYTPTAGNHMFVRWYSGETGFYAHDVLPRLEVGLFSAYIFYGILHPLTPYTVTPGYATGYAGPDGYFGANVGDPLLPGDTVTVTTPREVLTLPLPLLTARVDRAAAAVSGQAPPGAPLEVSLSAYPLHLFRQVTATAAGTYTVSFPEVESFAGASGMVRYTNPQGHIVFLEFNARAWFVTLGERCVNGYADMAGAPFTATLQTADGFTESLTGTASTFNASFQVCFSRPVGVGDRLILEQVGGETEFVLPRLTATHDWATQILEGEAPPGALVEMAFPRGWFGVSRRTVADGSGRYRLDTRDLGLRVGESGLVAVTDGQGNVARLAFQVQGHRVYLPVVAR